MWSGVSLIHLVDVLQTHEGLKEVNAQRESTAQTVLSFCSSIRASSSSTWGWPEDSTHARTAHAQCVFRVSVRVSGQEDAVFSD